MTKTKKTIVYVDENDFRFYQKLVKKHHLFKNNIHLFTCAVLIGKFLLKKPKNIPKGHKKDLFRVIDNLDDENMAILKCIAISSMDDVDIIADENKLFSYCERYANSGIKQIEEWYEGAYDFDTEFSKVLLNAWNDIDFDKLEQN